ncbi:DUF4189 domain-containing protein [Mycolicibacterium hodleri]|uniref:DUF4189 domain-containing protein n=1 Tax=Mycolicibacterium hodleri TaxID=49897 RepID=A0A502EB52_9MYCO|nr:DUF4189 domain-containing protein [Mycolicibacterium hodleri]TPG34162.1 DUF4189 domain-containing protein [Mycolicibacterium hodleri]
MTSNITPQRRIRLAAGIILIAAAASGAGLLSAATADAAPDAYVALSVGLAGDNPPVQTIGGMSIGPDADQARIASLSNCQNNGGNHCVFEVSAMNACAAAAANDYGEIEAASDPSVQVAKTNALSKLESSQGAHIVVSGCANGQIDPPAPPPNNPPAPPKQGPTVSFKVIVGGIQAHITDRSGVTSQCTYATDNVNRSFALPANSSYDLKIVPAIPQFRNWTVTIACDNGTSTQATTYF